MNATDALLSDNGQPLCFCDCPETLLGEGRDRRRIPSPPGHNCNYCRQRALLVPVAERRAFERVEQLSAEDDSAATRNVRFTRAFAIEMDRLSEPLLKNGASP